MVFGLVPCLSTISWLSRGPLETAINYVWDELETTTAKGGGQPLSGALICAPEQADCCWRPFRGLSVQSHQGQKSQGEDAVSCSACSCQSKHSDCGSYEDQFLSPPFGGGADIWAPEPGGLQWPTFRVDPVSPPDRLHIDFLAHEDLAFGPLRIEKFGCLLGTGTYGQVFEAEVSGVGRAAVKLLNEEMLQKEGNLDQSYADFVLEADLQCRCQHRNVVRCHGMGSPLASDGCARNGQPVMVMELMAPDSTLTNLLRSSGGLSRHRLLSCALDIARALQYVHSLGIIHFDVKSQNVMVDSWGVCKLTDFGLAFDARGKPLDFFGRGSVAYMAPEIHDRSRMVDEKVDVFSFGIFMWEIATGAEPHSALTYDEIVEGVLYRGLRPPLQEAMSGAGDSAWIDLMTECWREAPQTRPSAATVVTRLEALLLT